MKLTALTVLASAIAPALAATYPITSDSVNCHSRPGTSYTVKKTYDKGYGDKTSDGYYVCNYYVKTGANGYITRKYDMDATSYPTIGYGYLCSDSKCLGDSTLVKRLNNGENVNTVLSEELPKWVHGNSAVLPGLVRRRNAEIALAKKATSDKALPVKC
ncbi:hypothetical protein NEMBOFW57_004046 [Staphylotrichum longicolle]|uniref:Uncharacterized protein n=1 Tax=Staphylotrichum longicolle TaxID=669026 RepID=A0AAD4I590_9PEZI|nr:hypothetical protein NEMBOFW57_004046 [Staphylotrichum longicolle]